MTRPPSLFWQTIPEEWHSDLIDAYRTKLLDPRAWIGSGDRMLRAADLLKSAAEAYWTEARKLAKREVEYLPSDHDDAYLMLLGLAAENFLKATVIATRGTELRDAIESATEYLSLPPPLPTHNLSELMEAAGFSLTGELEEAPLKAMQIRVEWSGRYPIPRRVRDTDHFSGVSSSAWVEMSRGLVERMRAAAVQAIQDSG